MYIAEMHDMLVGNSIMFGDKQTYDQLYPYLTTSCHTSRIHGTHTGTLLSPYTRVTGVASKAKLAATYTH